MATSSRNDGHAAAGAASRARRRPGGSPGTKTGTPKVTRLYAIQPRGLGTSEVEALSSVVSRLAEQHVVRPSSLLRDEVLEPRRRRTGQRHQIFEAVKCPMSINGARRATTVIVDALTKATGCDRLVETTLIARDEGIAFLDSSFRDVRAWCPECLADPEPYDRLVWSLKAVETCARHCRLLVDACPSCAAQHRAWQRGGPLDTCPFCNTSLADPKLMAMPANPSAVERIVRDLLAGLLSGRLVTKEQLAFGVMSLLRDTMWGDAARKAGVSRSTLGGIRRKTARPSLEAFVRIVIGSGEPVRVFLAHRPARIRTYSNLAAPALPTVVLSAPTRRRYQLPASVETELRAAPSLPFGQIPSVRAFARAHAVTPWVLRNRFPELVRSLAQASDAQIRQGGAARIASECALVREAVLAAATHGTVPSRRQVEDQLSRPALLIHEHCKRALDLALEEVRNAA